MKSILPVLFVLICPLMMLFMMRGMHGQNHDHGKGERAPARDSQAILDELRNMRQDLELRMDDLNGRINSIELKSVRSQGTGRAGEIAGVSGGDI
jgi:hypothetical protein